MTFVKANGLVIHYVDEGRRDGPPIVFIMRSAAIYASGPRLLRSSRPSFASSPTTSAATAYPKSGPDKCEMAAPDGAVIDVETKDVVDNKPIMLANPLFVSWRK